jgi:GH35 family endo-1,4-beta-xylanase
MKLEVRLIAFLVSASVVGAEDAYHTALKRQLETQYGVTGGSWVLPDNEAATNSLGAATNLSKKTLDWTGAEPFTKALELKTTRAQANSWDAAIRFVTQSSAAAGDRLLLVLWIRSIQAEIGTGQIEHIFEMTDNPYTKSLNRGAIPAASWQQWMIPFEAVMDHTSGKARYQINMGVMAQTLQVGGIAVLNYGKKYALSRLPESRWHLDYEGRDPNAPWRAAARARIEKYRKGPLTVRVLDRSGAPLPGATVRADMLRHEFGFGTAVAYGRATGGSPEDLKYQEKLENLAGNGRTFSIVVLENALKWPNWELDGYDGSKDDVANLVAWFRGMDIDVRGHNLVWPDWQWMPDDLSSHKTDSAYVGRRIRGHLEDILTWPGIQGVLREWDAVNETLGWNALRDLFKGEQIYADVFRIAKTLDPAARMFINEAGLTDRGGLNVAAINKLKSTIAFINGHGGLVEGIGFQSHAGYPLTPPERVYQVFEEFAGFGADLAVTEYDAQGVQDSIAADYLEDILTVSFSHPAMKSFLMWGFWDGAHWLDDAPLFYRNWTLKPSGERFLDLVFNRWWTSAEAATGPEGEASVSGFYGTYRITASAAGATATVETDYAAEGGPVEVRLDTEASGAEEAGFGPLRFSLEQNHPNPFNPSTTIAFSITKRTRTRVEVFDAAGRLVRTLADGPFEPGRHTHKFHARDLPSGIYLCRLEAAGFAETKKMLLVR